MKLIRQVSAVSAANVVNGLAGVVFVPVAIHRLGAGGYGLFATFTVISSYLFLLELGLGKRMLQRVASATRADTAEEEVRRTTGVYVVIAGLVVVALPALVFVAPLVFGITEGTAAAALRTITVLAAIDYVLGIPTNLIKTQSMVDVRFGAYAQFRGISGLLRYGLGLVGVLVTTRPELVVGIVVARRFIELPVAFALVGRLPAGAMRPLVSPASVWKTVRQTSPLAAGYVLQTLVLSIGTILVSQVSGLAAMGVYRASFDLASKVWFFSNSFGLVVFPYLARRLATAEGRSWLGSVLPDAFGASALGYAILAMAGALAGRWLLPLVGLAGSAYVGLFGLLLAGVALNAFAGLPYELIIATGRFEKGIRPMLGGLIVMVGVFFLAEWLSPGFGIGWSWLVGQMLYCALCVSGAIKLIPVPGPAARRLKLMGWGWFAALGAAGWAALTTEPMRVALFGVVIPGLLIAAAAALVVPSAYRVAREEGLVSWGRA